MSENNNTSAKKNFFYQASYQFLLLIIPIITSPYISRVLGAANIGIYSYTYTTASYFVLFSQLGIVNYGNREISRSRDSKEKLDSTFSGIFYLHLIVSSIVAITYVVYYFQLANKEYRPYVLIQGLYVLSALFDVTWLFNGLENFKITVTRNVIIKLISTACIFIFVRSRDDLVKYCLVLAAANFASQVYLWFYLKDYVHFRHLGGKEIVKHLKPMLILFIPTIAISIYNYMDKIMLGKLSSNTELGFYDNSEKITFMAISVIGSLGTVMLPRMSNLFVNNKFDEIKKYISLSMKFIGWLSCAIAFGIIGVSKVFSVVFWGPEFAPCAAIVTGLAIVLPIQGFANVLRTQFLIPNKKDISYTVSVSLGAIVNFIINYLLIPKYSAIGAVIGTVVAESVVCIVQTVACYRDLPVWRYAISNLIYIIFGILMSVVVYVVGNILGIRTITLLIQIITGLVIYLTLTYIYEKITGQKFITLELKKFLRVKKNN